MCCALHGSPGLSAPQLCTELMAARRQSCLNDCLHHQGQSIGDWGVTSCSIVRDIEHARNSVCKKKCQETVMFVRIGVPNIADSKICNI